MWLLLLLAAGVVLVAAKNVAGEDVPIGRRPIDGEKGGHYFTVGVTGRWELRGLDDSLRASGSATGRRSGFLAAISALLQREPHTVDGLTFRFRGHEDASPVFTCTVSRSQGGSLLQVLDPRATVVAMGTYAAQSDAIRAGYDYVDKAGY